MQNGFHMLNIWAYVCLYLCCQFSKQANKGIGKKTAKVAPAIVLENSRVQEGVEAKVTEEISIVETKESHQSILPVGLTENGQTNSIKARDVGEASIIIAKQTSSKHTLRKSPFKKGYSSSPPAHNVLKNGLICYLYIHWLSDANFHFIMCFIVSVSTPWFIFLVNMRIDSCKHLYAHYYLFRIPWW